MSGTSERYRVLDVLRGVGILGILPVNIIFFARPLAKGEAATAGDSDWDIFVAHFTEFFFQSLLCTAIFYSWGLGLFGRFDRGALFLIVVAIWAVQLVLSTLWLERYATGPLERVWRRVTYGARR